MSLQPFLINNYEKGLQKDKKPFLILDTAFQELNNAFVWRNRVKKREGIKLLGRLRRVFTSETISTTTPAAVDTITYQNIFASLDLSRVAGLISNATQAPICQVTTSTNHNLLTGDLITINNVGGMVELNGNPYTIVRIDATNFTIGVDSSLFGVYTSGGDWTTQPNAEIEPGTAAIPLLVITVGAPDGATFSDQGDGTFAVTDAGFAAGSYVDYTTGLVVLKFTGALTGGATVTAAINYFPSLPCMGIPSRELAAINVEQAIFFDTKYAYIHDGNDFSELASTTPVTWTGSDNDFFWAANYRGSTATNRYFFVTNFSRDTSDPIRYYDGDNWESLTPTLSNTSVTGESLGTLTTPWTSFGPASISNLPITPGTLTVTVNNGVDPNVVYTDVNEDGTLTATAPTNTGTIDYVTGAISLSINPAMTQNAAVTITYNLGISLLYQAKIIVPYYGRLVMLNTWEGTAAAGFDGSTNSFNRCRFPQIGDPTAVDAWYQDEFGKGGFIDAPTNEAIVSARFYKDTLIVFFERTTWKLQYVGEYGLPFIWERISSDFGSESTFSTILFDGGVLGVGDKAVVGASSNDVQRIDSQIPNAVFGFRNAESGKKRIHGIRDFQKEVVYWTYSDGYIKDKFPNRVLLYNYRNDSWAIFRDNVTAFGQFTAPVGISWDVPISWDTAVSWDTAEISEFPLLVSGNQQGFIHFYQQVGDLESAADSNINAIENESLSISGETRSATANWQLTVVNHNLIALEVIYITNVKFVVTADSTTPTTDLNDRFYQVQNVVDDDTIDVVFWDETSLTYQTSSGGNMGFVPATGTGTYIGGGAITLMPKLSIRTKDFNPFQDQGKQMMLNYVDFQTDATANAAVSVELDINSATEVTGNVLVGNTETETSLNNFGDITNVTQANPAQVTSPNHGLKTGDEITIQNGGGMTELDGNPYKVTFVDLNNFTLDGVDATVGFTAYSAGGNWIQKASQIYYVPGSNYAWHRFYASAYGQYVTLHITYDDELMNSLITHQQKFEMNAMILWARAAGRIV